MFVIEGEYTTATVYVDDESSLDQGTKSQLYDLVNHPAFRNPICVMPDVHQGKGVVIGFSMPLGERICPEVVGTDIGCGMHAWRLGDDLPLSDADRDQQIRKRIPGDGRDADRDVRINDEYPSEQAMGTFRKFASSYKDRFGERIVPPFEFSEYGSEYIDGLCERVGISRATIERDAGTLGGGNHFIEFGQSESTGDYWLVIHSGSRSLGKSVAKYWMDRTQNGRHLGWLTDEEAFGYFVDMVFCQEYAAWNRELMGERVLDVLDITPEVDFRAVHNYIDFEDLVIRKGATRSYSGDPIVIPIHAAAGMLLCEGVSNEDANFTAPHGAGRVLSRGDAKDVYSTEEFESALDGVYMDGNMSSLVSEIPHAYKDVDFLLRHLDGLAEVRDRLQPVHNVKYR